MCFNQSDVLIVNVAVANRVHESVDAGLQEVFSVCERRGPAQVRKSLHPVLVRLVDNRAKDLGLELRYGAFTIVNPKLDDMNTARVQLPNVLATLFSRRGPVMNTE